MNEKMQPAATHAAPFEPLEQRRMLTTVTAPLFASYADPADVGGDGSDLIVGDFNGDGALDLVDRGTARFGKPGGGLSGETANLYATAGSLYSTAAGDVTGDGVDDLVGLADGELMVVTFDGTTARLLTDLAPVGLNADHVRLGDFDGDGDLDAAFADFAEETVDGAYTFTRHLAFAWNDGSGNFSDPTRLAVDRSVSPSKATLVDLDGDGRDELFLPRHFGGSGFVSALFEVQPNDTLQVRTGEATSTLGGKAAGYDSDGDGTRDTVAGVANDGGETSLYRWSLDGNAIVRDGGTVIPGGGTLASFTAFRDATANVPVMALGHGDGTVAVHAIPAEGAAVGAAIDTLSLTGDPAADLMALDANGDGTIDLLINQPTGASVATADAPDVGAAPRVDFTPADRIEEGDPTRFNATVLAGNPTSFSWNFGDGATAAGRAASHAFAEDGTYTVTLTAVDGLGRTTTQSRSVRVVNANPKVDVGLPEKVGRGEGPEYVLKVSDANATDLAGLRYVVDWHDGTSDSGRVGSDGSLTIRRHFEMAGAQPYTLLVADAEGGETIVKGEVDVAADAADAATNPVRLSGGTLEVFGTNDADTITLLPSGDNDVEVVLNGTSHGVYDARGIVIHAGGGDDVIDFSKLGVTHYGTSRVMAGGGDDVVRGGAGNDTLFGMAGDDHLDGGDGDDYLGGSAGDDRLVGGRGNDELVGGRGGNDTADYSANAKDQPVNVSIGGDSDDGLGGVDRVAGSVEHLVGGRGDDRLNGSRGSNFLDGGPGDNILWGGDGGENLLVATSAHDAQRRPISAMTARDKAEAKSLFTYGRKDGNSSSATAAGVHPMSAVRERLFAFDLSDDELRRAA